MAKPNALAGLVDQVEREQAEQPVPESAGRVTAPGRPERGRPRNGEPARPSTRADRKAITVYFPPEVSYGLRELALKEGTTLQALVGESLDLLMRNRGQHPFGAR